MTHKKHGSTSAAYLRHYDFVLDFSYIFIYYIQNKIKRNIPFSFKNTLLYTTTRATIKTTKSILFSH